MTQQVEKRLLNEYLHQIFPVAATWKNVRVGPWVLPSDTSRLSSEPSPYAKPFRRWADAILWDGFVIWIVEAKVYADPAGLAELELYSQLFPDTPEFSLYKDAPIRLLFVCAVGDYNVEALAIQKDIFYTVFRPAWVEEYLRR